MFFSLFFTSSLNVFLTAVSCDWTVAEPTLLGFTSATGGAIACFSGGNAVYAVVGILMAILFISIAALLTVVDFERDFLSTDPLAMPSSRPEITIFLCKISFTLISVMLGQFLLPLAICYSIISAIMAFTTIRYLPFLRGWANQLRFTLYGLLCFEALVTIVVTVVNDTASDAPTILAIAGAPVVAGILVWVSASRLDASDGRWLVVDATAEMEHPFASTPDHSSAQSSYAPNDADGNDRVFRGDDARDWHERSGAQHGAARLAPGGPFCLKRLGEVPQSNVLQVRTVFSTPLDVEIAARFATQSGLRTSGWVRAADRIYRHGLALFPNSAYLHLAYASFLTATNAPGNISTAKIHTERARRCKPSLADVFALFVRDTKRKHMAQSEAVGADHDMDLVSYVEFSHQLSLVQKTHRATLKAVRRFWKAILAIQAAGGEITVGGAAGAGGAKTVTPATVSQYRATQAGSAAASPAARGERGQGHWATTAQPAAALLISPESAASVRTRGSKRQTRAKAFLESLGGGAPDARGTTIAVDADMLAKLFLRIDNLEGKAKAIYGVLLDKYPKSPKLLRAHGRFQRDVLREMRESDRCFSEAQRIEDMQRDAATQDGHSSGSGTINDASDALVVINDRGIITTANKPAAAMFRTTVSQLTGKPVGILMEAARAAQHPTYMREYLNTGVSHIIGKSRRVWAKRFDNSLFPVELSVSQIDDGMGGIAFAGMLVELPEDATLARLTVTATGIITTASCGIERMFGMRVSDIVRRKLSAILPSSAPMLCADDIETRFPVNTSIRASGLHKNMATFPVEVTLRLLDVRPSGLRKKSGLRVVASEPAGAATSVASAIGSKPRTRSEQSGRVGRARRAPVDGYEVIVKELVGEYGLVSISEKGEIISVSSGALQLFGYDDEQELLGRNVNMLMPLPYRAFHDSYLRRYMATGAATVVGKSPRSVPAVRRDGRTISVMLEVKETTPDKSATPAGVAGPGALRSRDGKHGDAAVGAKGGAGADGAEHKEHPHDEEEVEEELGLGVGRPKFHRLFTAKLVLLKNADDFEKEAREASADSAVSSAVPTSVSAASGFDAEEVLSSPDSSRLLTTRVRRGTGTGTGAVGGCPVLHSSRGTPDLDAKHHSDASASTYQLLAAAGVAASEALSADGAAGSSVDSLQPQSPTHSSAGPVVPSSVPSLRPSGGLPAPSASGSSGDASVTRVGKSSLSQRTRLLAERRRQQQQQPPQVLPRPAGKCPFHLPVPEAGLPEVADRELKTMSGRLPADFDEWEARARQHLAQLDSDPLRAVVLADRTSRIVFANAKVGNLFGINSHKLVGHSVAIFCPPEIATRHDELVQRYRATRSPHVIGTPGRHIVARKAGGSLFSVSLLMDEADPAIKAALVYRAKIERAQRRVAKAAMEMVDDEPVAVPLVARQRGSSNTSKDSARAGGRRVQDSSDGVSLRDILLQCLQEASAPAGPFGEALVPGSLALKHHIEARARGVGPQAVGRLQTKQGVAHAPSAPIASALARVATDATAIPVETSEADAAEALEGHTHDEAASHPNGLVMDPTAAMAAAVAAADVQASATAAAAASDEHDTEEDEEAQLASQGGVNANNTYVHQYDKTKPILGFVAYLYGLDELEAVVTVDDELIIRHTNAAMWHVTGLYTSELRGTPLARLFPDEDFTEVLEAAKWRRRCEEAAENTLAGDKGNGRAADDTVVDHLMAEVKRAAAAGISPLDMLAQEAGESDGESVDDAAAMRHAGEAASAAQPRLKLPVPELVGGRKTIELRHRIGDNVSVLVEFAEVHVPRGAHPVTTVPLDSCFEVSAHRHKSRTRTVLPSKAGAVSAAAVGMPAGSGSGTDAEGDFGDTGAAKITYDVYYTGRIVLATASRQEIEARARSVAKSVLRSKKKKRKQHQEKLRQRKAKRLGTKTGREIADSDLPGYEGRRQSELAQAMGLGSNGRRPSSRGQATAVDAAAAALAASGSPSGTSGVAGMSRMPSFAVYKSTAAPDALLRRAELRRQGLLHVRFSREAIEHDEQRQTSSTAKYYPKEGRTIARTKTLVRLASKGNVGSAAAKVAASAEEELRLTNKDADRLSEAGSHSPNSSIPTSSRTSGSGTEQSTLGGITGLDDALAMAFVKPAEHDSEAGTSGGGDEAAEWEGGAGDARRAAAGGAAAAKGALPHSRHIPTPSSSNASTTCGESHEDWQERGEGQGGGGMARTQSAGAMSSGGESEASDASEGSARTGTTMASALDRYLMGEDLSDATSRDESDLSGDGSSLGGGSKGWRDGAMSSDGQSGPNTDEDGAGFSGSPGVRRKQSRRNDAYREEEVDNEDLMAKRQRQADRQRSRQRHLKRLQRNQRLSSSVANLRTLAMWLLLSFIAVFVVPFGVLLSLDSEYSALVKAQFIAGKLQEAVLRESIVLGRLEWETSDPSRSSASAASSVALWNAHREWVYTGKDHVVTPRMLQAEAGVSAQEIATMHRALCLGAQHASVATGGEALATTAQGLDPDSLNAVVPLSTRLEAMSAGISSLHGGFSDLASTIGQGSATVRRLFDGAPHLVRFEQGSTSLFELGELYWRSAAELAAPVNGSVHLPDPTSLTAAVMQPYPTINVSQSIEGIGTAVDGTAYGAKSFVDAANIGIPPQPAVVSARQQSWLNGSAEFWAVLDNGAAFLATGLATASQARQSRVSSMLDTLLGMVGAALAVETAIPLVAVLCLLQPAFARISKERVDTFKVFLRVDQSVVLRLSKMAVKVENNESESDSSSDEGAGRGAHLAHHHQAHQAHHVVTTSATATASVSHSTFDNAGKHLTIAAPDTAVPGRAGSLASSGSGTVDVQSVATSGTGEDVTEAQSPPRAARGGPDVLLDGVAETAGVDSGDSPKVGRPLASAVMHGRVGVPVGSVGTALFGNTTTVDATAVTMPTGLGRTQDIGPASPGAATHTDSSKATEEGPTVLPGSAINVPLVDAKVAASDAAVVVHASFPASPSQLSSEMASYPGKTISNSAGALVVRNGAAARQPMSTGYQFGSHLSRPGSGSGIAPTRRRRQSSVFGQLAARLARLASLEGTNQDWVAGHAPEAGQGPVAGGPGQGVLRACWTRIRSAVCGGCGASGSAGALPRSMHLSALGLLAIVVLASVVSLLLLSSTRRLADSLFLAGRRSAAAAATQLWALRLVTAAARGSPADVIAEARAEMEAHAGALEATHNEILFGSPLGAGSDAASLTGVPRSGTESSRLFEPSCLRSDARPGACLHSEHPFAAVSLSGMHGLLRRFVAEARALALQPAATLAQGPASNDAFLLVWTAGEADLRDGLEASALGYEEAVLALLGIRQLTDSLALVALVGATVGIYLFIVQPFIERISAETQRAARMVSLLPAEVDIRTLIPRRRRARIQAASA